MKNILIALFCAFTTLFFAQKNITTVEDFQLPNWKVLLSKLDTTQIKSGILIDKTTSFANLLFYNTNKHNTSSYEHFVQGLSEVHRASLNKKSKMQYEIIDDILHKKDNVLNISFINTTVDYVDYGTKDQPNLSFRDGFF